MPTHLRRAPFDPVQEYFVTKQFLLNGKVLAPGQPFDKLAVAPRRLRQLYDTRYLGMIKPKGLNVPPPEPAPEPRRRVERIRLG